MAKRTNRVAWALAAMIGALPGPVRSGSRSINRGPARRAHASSSAPRIVPEPVRIAHQGSRLIITPVPALRQAIGRYFPGYELPPLTAFEPGMRKLLLLTKPPAGEPAVSFICVGDFDGNGLPDVALFLKNRRNRWLLVAFHQTHRGEFRTYRLTRADPLPDGSFACWITRHPPGRVQSYATEGMGDTEAAGRSKYEWIEEEDDGATENFGYYFKGGQYRRVRI